MQQLFTKSDLPVILLALLPLLAGCTHRVPCHELSGRWSTGEGQEFVFQNDGKALWLTRFGSQFDTVPFEYQLDCKTEPATLDMQHFKNGPYSDKSLFGILEWTSDTSFRLRYEPGVSEEARPSEFDHETTLKFFPAR